MRQIACLGVGKMAYPGLFSCPLRYSWEECAEPAMCLESLPVTPGVEQPVPQRFNTLAEECHTKKSRQPAGGCLPEGNSTVEW